jgi:hypothetical protein
MGHWGLSHHREYEPLSFVIERTMLRLVLAAVGVMVGIAVIALALRQLS